MRTSIIVPAYNSGKCIAKCMESILQQTEKDFEVLIVDDGSTDDTAEVVKQYSERDQRIRLISKDNGGVSSARNCGLDNAKGDYIIFIDSDDYVPCDMLERLEDSLFSGNVDIVMGKMYHVDSRTGSIRKHELEAPLIDCVMNPQDPDRLKKIIVGYALHKGVAYSNLAKIYKKDIIQKHGIRFDTETSFCEDVLFNIAYFRHIRDAKVDDDYYYYALDNDNSLTKCFHPDMPVVLRTVYLEFLNCFSEMGFLDHALQMSMDIQFLNNVWDLVFRVLTGKYVNLPPAETKKTATAILKMPEVVSLMKKYRHTPGICGTSTLGNVASHFYFARHEEITVGIIKNCIKMRALIKLARQA